MGSVHEIRVPDLINRFNESVAEIETHYIWQFDPKKLILAQVTESTKKNVTVQLKHARSSVQLPYRSDIVPGDHLFIIETQKNSYQWARMSDCGSSKDTLLPAVDPQTMHTSPELTDTIFEIDNKSITHRPDLWSHRGIAREIASLFNFELKNADEIYADIPVTRIITKKDNYPSAGPWPRIEASDACRRLAAAYIAAPWQPSNFNTMLRLCRIDSRPIDGLVDLTNYVMLDIGQPMHVFDADKVSQGALIARYAHVGEKLTVLDGSVLELHPQDLILADDKKPLSLAGVMGGLESAVSRTTKKLVIEAGSFEPTTVRLSAARYTKRTEATTRFEKNLDPAIATRALQRYLKLLTHHDTTSHIVDCGPDVQPVTVNVSHKFIEQRLGTSLKPETVHAILTALEFEVVLDTKGNKTIFLVSVPSYRATKDIHIPEDIVEEVGRFIGYRTIPAQLPFMQHEPHVPQTSYRTRALKQYCASVLRMHEISSYPFFDESWLVHLRWQPATTLEVINPLSGNWRRLVTSLICALLKAVHENAEGITDIRYFELARTWLYTSPITEQKSLAGVIYSRNQETDFYTLKQYVDELCAHVGITLTWQPVDTTTLAPWYDPYCVAQCLYNDQLIGTVGLLAQSWKDRIVQTGFVGIFELDAVTLLGAKVPPIHYAKLPKYPDIVRDVSVLMPTNMRATDIITRIKQIDRRIHAVELVDFFKKPAWKDRISLSIRYVIRDETKTLTSDEANVITQQIEAMLKELDGELR